MGDPYVSTSCIHYRGIAVSCRAGIDVSQLVDAGGRVPCVSVRSISGTTPCAQREMPRVSPPGELGPMSKMLRAILDERCPRCGEAINGEMEFNGAILALPCRHVLRSAGDH